MPKYTYRHGDSNAICDRTGFKVLKSRTRKEWNGLIVRDEEWEVRHPQDYVRGRADRQSIREPRPESTDYFLATNETLGADSDAVVITDDGDSGPDSPNSNAQVHTYSSIVSSRDTSFVMLTWTNQTTASTTLISATWGGAPMKILVQDVRESGDFVGAAICGIDGAQTGDVVVTFNAATYDSNLTAVSLDNVISYEGESVSSDTNEGDSAGGALSSLNGPGAQGISLFLFSHAADTSAVTWTGVTGIADGDAGAHRHTAGYDLAALPSTTSAASAGSNDWILVGASFR